MTDQQRIVLGVTGNIASGKSTVVGIMKEHGAHHIDSDLVYRDLVQPGMPLLQTLAESFGSHIIAANGLLDRKALGAIVFSDPEQLARLDRLTHPAVIAESNRRVAAVREGVVIIDAVKLIESGHADTCDEVWLVTAPEKTQIARLMVRNDLTEDEARKRVAAQPPLEPKIAIADRIIPNSGTLEQLRATVDAAWYMLTGRDNASEKKGTLL
jgi:dephospho-CoA kinase